MSASLQLLGEFEVIPDYDQLPAATPRPQCQACGDRPADGVLYRGSLIRRRGRRGTRAVHLRETCRPVCESCVPAGARQLGPHEWWVRA